MQKHGVGAEPRSRLWVSGMGGSAGPTATPGLSRSRGNSCVLNPVLRWGRVESRKALVLCKGVFFNLHFLGDHILQNRVCFCQLGESPLLCQALEEAVSSKQQLPTPFLLFSFTAGEFPLLQRPSPQTTWEK